MSINAVLRRHEDELDRASLAREIDAHRDLLQRTCEAAGVPDLDPADLPEMIKQLLKPRPERRRHALRSSAESRMLTAVRRTPWRPLIVIARTVSHALGGEVGAEAIRDWARELQGVPSSAQQRACARVRDLLEDRPRTRAELIGGTGLSAEAVDGAIRLLQGAGAVRSEQAGRSSRWRRT